MIIFLYNLLRELLLIPLVREGSTVPCDSVVVLLFLSHHLGKLEAQCINLCTSGVGQPAPMGTDQVGEGEG